MQEQLDADTKALRTENYPKRKSQCNTRAGSGSHNERDEKEEKEKHGNEKEDDSRRTHRRVLSNAQISQQASINKPHAQPSQDAESGSAVNVACDKCYDDRSHHRHKSEKERRRHSVP